jgi:hypothetical protein
MDGSLSSSMPQPPEYRDYRCGSLWLANTRIFICFVYCCMSRT